MMENQKYQYGMTEQNTYQSELQGVNISQLLQIFKYASNYTSMKSFSCQFAFSNEKDKQEFDKIQNHFLRINKNEFRDITPYKCDSSEELSDYDENLDSEDEEIEQQILEQPEVDLKIPQIVENINLDESKLFDYSVLEQPKKNKFPSFEMDVKSYQDALVLNGYFLNKRDRRFDILRPKKERDIAHKIQVQMLQNEREEQIKSHIEVVYGSLFQHKVFLTKMQYLQLRNSRKLQQELYERFKINFAYDVNYFHQTNPDPRLFYFILFGYNDADFKGAQSFLLQKQLVKIYFLTLNSRINSKSYKDQNERKRLSFMRMEVFKTKFAQEDQTKKGSFLYELASIDIPKILQKQGMILNYQENFDSDFSGVCRYFYSKIYWSVTSSEKLHGQEQIGHFRVEKQNNEIITLYLTDSKKPQEVITVIAENRNICKKLIIQKQDIKIENENNFEEIDLSQYLSSASFNSLIQKIEKIFTTYREQIDFSSKQEIQQKLKNFKDQNLKAINNMNEILYNQKKKPQLNQNIPKQGKNQTNFQQPLKKAQSTPSTEKIIQTPKQIPVKQEIPLNKLEQKQIKPRNSDQEQIVQRIPAIPQQSQNQQLIDKPPNFINYPQQVQQIVNKNNPNQGTLQISQKMTKEKQEKLKQYIFQNKKLIQENEYASLSQELQDFLKQKIKRKKFTLHQITNHQNRSGDQLVRYYQSTFEDEEFKLKDIKEKLIPSIFIYIFLIEEKYLIQQNEYYSLNDNYTKYPIYYIKIDS